MLSSFLLFSQKQQEREERIQKENNVKYNSRYDHQANDQYEEYSTGSFYEQTVSHNSL